MRLKVKDLDISTGGPLIAVVNENDARILDLHPLDRIKIVKNSSIETVVVDISKGNGFVAPGCIGIMKEVMDFLKVKDGDSVEIQIARKPLSLEYIKKKLDGYHLNKKEIGQIVWDIVHNKLSQVELTFFISASYCHPNTMDETVWLTEAMTKEGQRLLNLDKRIIIDKHSIGGIPGNRTTMIVVPIMAAAGYTMPKTSSRAITSPAGTADTMEVLANVVFPLKKMRQIIKKANGCIVWGGALNLAPADDKIINIEKSLMIDAESQLLASIMAKKNSVSSTHVIIDIPIGPNSKIADRKKAMRLKRKFQEIGKRLRMKIKVVLTDGRQPIGSGIGPALEARDVLKVLRQDKDRPMDLEQKCLLIASKLFEIVGKRNGKQMAQEILKTGKAYEKMKEIIKLQGGNPELKPENIKLASFKYDFLSGRNGKVKTINNLYVAKLARIAGAPQNKGAGIYLHKHIGEKITKGEKILTVYAGSEHALNYVKQVLEGMKDIIDY